MEPLAFFLIGLPLVFIANKMVIALTDFEEEDEEETAEGSPEWKQRVYPWQVEPWPARVRFVVLSTIPLFLAGAGARFDVAQATVVSMLVVGLLICTATDLLRYRVPNVITYPSIGIALVAAAVMPDSDFMGAAVAALVGGGIFYILSLLTRGGIGLGDAKLVTLIGAMLGPLAGWEAIIIGVMAAGVALLPLWLLSLLGRGRLGRKDTIPYAPFLAMAAAVVALAEGTAFAPL